MYEDFKTIKEEIPIKRVADVLLQHSKGVDYYFPGEDTASIRIFPDSNSYYDFGRATGGDVIKLWAEVKNVSSLKAVKDMAQVFGVKIGKDYYKGNKATKTAPEGLTDAPKSRKEAVALVSRINAFNMDQLTEEAEHTTEIDRLAQIEMKREHFNNAFLDVVDKILGKGKYKRSV